MIHKVKLFKQILELKLKAATDSNKRKIQILQQKLDELTENTDTTKK
jgi:hypothetical protein